MFIFALLAFLVYFPNATATCTKWQTLFCHLGLELVYRPRYLFLYTVQFRFFLVLLIIFAPFPTEFTLFLFFSIFWYFCYTAKTRPCNVDSFTRLRLVLLFLAVWTAFVALITCALNKNVLKNPNEPPASHADRYLFVIGYILIVTVYNMRHTISQFFENRQLGWVLEFCFGHPVSPVSQSDSLADSEFYSNQDSIRTPNRKRHNLRALMKSNYGDLSEPFLVDSPSNDSLTLNASSIQNMNHSDADPLSAPLQSINPVNHPHSVNSKPLPRGHSTGQYFPPRKPFRRGSHRKPVSSRGHRKPSRAPRRKPTIRHAHNVS